MKVSINYPVYLGVKLDIKLKFKKHCIKMKMIVQTGNNLSKKTVGYSIGSTATHCSEKHITAGEYVCPVWSRLKHVKHVDVALNVKL